MDSTLRKYWDKHRKENPNHYVWMGMNFTHCETCKDHAHYWKPGWMVQHNSDYSIHNRINVKEI